MWSARDQRLPKLWLVLRKLSARLDRRAESVLQAEVGVGLASFMVMAAVAGREGAFNQQSVAELLGVTKGAVSRQIAITHAAGLVSVRVSSTSRRNKIVTLTPAGATAVSTAMTLLSDFPRVDGVSPVGLTSTIRLLEQLELLYAGAQSKFTSPTVNGLSRLWFLVRKNVLLMDRAGESLFRDRLGVGLTQYLVLSAVADRPGSLNQRSLARHLGLDEASISRQIDVVSRAGLITVSRFGEESASRGKNAALTPDGIALLERGAEILTEVQPIVYSTLDGVALDLAIETVERIAEFEPESV